MHFLLKYCVWIYFCVHGLSANSLMHMDIQEKESLRHKSKEMFFHAYNNYMNFAFPADELMPLSCKGRYRDMEQSRGTVDEALGGFSLSLLDTLDTLFIMGEFDEFERAVHLACRNVTFDSDVMVSVFETTIRALGGLLGGHVSALVVKTANDSRMSWYNRQLLDMAVDLGDRLLPAFNTSTGLPYPHINLKSGKLSSNVKTCTACAGTLILEFAALSRLSGNPIYEQKASSALSYLWGRRNRHSDLVGTEINIDSGEWIRQESGVGAGIDSYYESLLKAYGLLGDSEYLKRFQTHYSAVQRYMGAPGHKAFPFSFLSVFMHRPSQRSRHYMDSLQAFWPGVQTINGDLNAAVAHHEMLYMVHKRHGLLPEAFTNEMDIYWPHYLIRPELAESTYLLFKSTGDAYYLHVGAELLASIEKYTLVPCGFAAIEDIRTMQHSDRMDSFVLAETFKYFYLLFSSAADLPIDLDGYILTTEAHLLPIGLHPARGRSSPPTGATATTTTITNPYARLWGESCAAPTPARRLRQAKSLLFGGGIDARVCDAVDGAGQRLWHRLEVEIRRPLRFLAGAMQMEREAGGRGRSGASAAAAAAAAAGMVPTLEASSLNVENITHLQMLRQMGISVMVAADGQIRLKFDQTSAETPTLGASGLVFMEEIIQLSGVETSISDQQQQQLQRRQQQQQQIGFKSQTVALGHPPHFGRTRFDAGPSRFSLYPGETDPSSPSPSDSPGWRPVVGRLVLVEPFDACSPVFVDGFYAPVEELHAEFLVSAPPQQDEDNAVVEHEDEEEAPAAAAAVPMPVKGDGSSGRGLLRGAIAVIKRGGCLFMDKALHVKQMGAVGAIVIDPTPGTTSSKDQLFQMSGDQANGSPPRQLIDGLPFVFLYNAEGLAVVGAMERRWRHQTLPAFAVVSKTDDAPRILSTALQYLDVESQAAESDELDQCFVLVPSISKPKTNCSTESPFTARLSEEGDWQITLNPGDAGVSFVLEDGADIFSKDPVTWSGFMDKHWPQTNNDNHCKDLILAVSEALLSQTTDRQSPFKSNSRVILSQERVGNLGTCLRNLEDREFVDDAAERGCLDGYLRLQWRSETSEACAG